MVIGDRPVHTEVGHEGGSNYVYMLTELQFKMRTHLGHRQKTFKLMYGTSYVMFVTNKQ